MAKQLYFGNKARILTRYSPKQHPIDNKCLHINELKAFFSKKETFSNKDLESFFKKVDSDISHSDRKSVV